MDCKYWVIVTIIIMDYNPSLIIHGYKWMIIGLSMTIYRGKKIMGDSHGIKNEKS